MYKIFSFFFLFMILFSSVAWAQGLSVEDYQKQRFQEQMQQSYSENVEQLFQNRFTGEALASVIADLRNEYPYTQEYSAFSDQIQDQMTQYAYLLDHAAGINEKADIIERYNIFLKEHIIDYDVANLAFVFSKQNIELGDPEFFENIILALEDDIVRGNFDGKTVRTSYRVVTFSENNYLLNYMNKEVLRSETYEMMDRYYNVYYLRDPETGDTSQLIVDVTVPIVQMRDLERERQQKIQKTIPKL